MKRIFIDGGSGTVGLGIRERLTDAAWARLETLPDSLRKDPGAKRELLSQVDAVVLCLPDAAAREAVSMIDELGKAGPRVLDASTAHRVAPGWVYGFRELSPEQPRSIRIARRVTNPGCYPTGAIALLRPLVDAGLLPRSHPLSINAVSGYSGGGRSMIEDFQAGRAPAFQLYALGLDHKHLPEMRHYSGLDREPLFVPSVGNFYQGMLVSIPLHLDGLPGGVTAQRLRDALVERYAGSEWVAVQPAGADVGGGLSPEGINGSNRLELFVHAHERRRHALLVARLDNLGKGASGAAAQNLELMLADG